VKEAFFEPSISHPYPFTPTKNETIESPPFFEFEAEPVVFSLIMWSEDAASEGALLLKVGFPLFLKFSLPESRGRLFRPS
jgi:hypothetical protein